jgi:hypothetical protein
MRVVTVERQDVEGVELDLIVMLARMQRVEIGDVIDAEHHHLTPAPKWAFRPLWSWTSSLSTV